MRSRKIVIVLFLIISMFAFGCTDKKMVNSTSVKSENTNTAESQNVNTSSDNKTGKTNITAASVKDYSKYTGTWVIETNLRNDFKYGMVAGIKVDKDGNIQGQISDATENLTHISNVDIKGKIEENQFEYKFQEDGWGHNGTINLQFGENKITMLIKYNADSSKDRFWGIGEGTFTLVNNTAKVTRTLNNLKDGGLQVIESQCFPVTLESFGQVKFISGEKRENSNIEANFYLLDGKDEEIYKFPDFYGNFKGRFNEFDAIAFTDINHDGLKDIVVIANYTDNVSNKSDGISSIYVQKGKAFISNKDFDEKMNKAVKVKDAAHIIEYAKENYK